MDTRKKNNNIFLQSIDFIYQTLFSTHFWHFSKHKTQHINTPNFTTFNNITHLQNQNQNQSFFKFYKLTFINTTTHAYTDKKELKIANL
jgi:hypothetical protein